MFLGVIIDENLSWKSQIQNVARKVSKSVISLNILGPPYVLSIIG